MIRHCVTFRFAEGTDPADVDALRAALSALPETITSIRGYWCGADLGLRDTNADFAVVADFDDGAGFLDYAGHPDHQAVIRAHVEPIVTERQSVQFSW